jgi:hypothetical protein
VAHAEEPVRLRGFGSLLIDADAVVADRHGKPVFVRRHGETDVPGLRMLHHVDQAFLHHAENGDVRVRRQVRQRLGVLFLAGEASAPHAFVRQPAQRRDQADIVEQRRPEALDDAPLEVQSLVQGAKHPVPAYGARFGAVIATASQQGDIDLGRHQQAAQFVVQLAGELGFFALGDLLQVAGKTGQHGRALAHDAVEFHVAFAQLQAFARPPLHIACEQHADQRDQREAESAGPGQQQARSAQVIAPAVGRRQQANALAMVEIGDQAADLGHRLLADVGVDERKRSGEVLLAIETQRAEHLAEPHARELAQFGGLRLLVFQRGGLVAGGDPVEQGVELLDRRVELPEVAGFLGQEEAALGGLGLEQQLHVA